MVTISSPASTSLNAAIEAKPIAAIGAVTFFVSDVPTLVALSPTPFIASPAAVRDLLKDALHSLAVSSSFFNSFSVSIISRCKASYCCWLISPFSSAVLACSAAVFRVSSFSFVLPISSASNLCFCANSSVLLGSSLRSLSTSFRSLCVFFISELTPLRAVCSLVVSPPISTVMPCILFAMGFLLY